MRSVSIRSGLVALVLTLASSGLAQAVTVFYSASIPIGITNWNGFLSFPKFDPAMGTLNGIDFLLEGTVQGNVQFENLASVPAIIQSTLQADITLYRPDLSLIVSTRPGVTNIDAVTAFDGFPDFGGTSGRTYIGLTASAASSVDLPPPGSDFALFTGPGTIALPIDALGTSTVRDENLITQIHTEAGATATVTYHYVPTAPVPEPRSLALLLLGGGILALGRKIRREACASPGGPGVGPENSVRRLRR